MCSSIAQTSDLETGSAHVNLTGSGLTTRLVVWGACLGLLVGASAVLLPDWTVGSYARAVFYTAAVVGYLTIFTHCLMRLIYSKWSSWFLYTIGFGGLSASRLLGVIISLCLLPDSIDKDVIELLRSALVPASIAVLVAAAHALRSRSKGNSGIWKTYVLLTLIVIALSLAWRSGLGRYLTYAIVSSQLEPQLLISITTLPAILTLLHLTHRMSKSEHDEIVAPVCYWSVAMSIGAIIALVLWNRPEILAAQTRGVELAGLAAMLFGLSLENERAHREASAQMSDLEAMQKISWSLVGAGNLSELTAAFASAISEGFGARSVVIYLQGGEPDELLVSAVTGIDDTESNIKTGNRYSLKPERRPGFHCGHTARAYASGEIQYVSEVFSDVEFLPWRIVARENGLVVSVPLPYQGKTIGVVNLFMPGVKILSNARARLLESIAAAISPAIENMLWRSVVDEVNTAA